MPKKLKYTTNSLTCLQDIARYIKKDSNKRAIDFINDIKTQIKKLKTFPKLGVEIEDNCRKLLVNKNYKIIYEVVSDDINILYVGNIKQNK